MATTTDMGDNAAIDAAIAEQSAIDELLPTMPGQEPNSSMASMDSDHVMTDVPQQTANPNDKPEIPQQANTTIPAATTLNPISRVGTPSIHANGNGYGGPPSRAASVQAEVTHTPTVAQKHGAPARQYMNEKITPHMLEIFKRLALEQPDNPLRVLAEFFEQRATETGQ